MSKKIGFRSSIRIVLKQFHRLIDTKRFFEINRFTWLYYVYRSRFQFRLNALQAGMKMNRKDQANVFNFRRSIHRIEKGLSFKHLRDVFAESYILETVNYLAQIESSGNLNVKTVSWGVSVLNEYFLKCKHTEQVSEAYSLFRNINLENKQPDWNPYCEKSRVNLSVDYHALYQLSLRRRSVRHYLDKEVEFTLIKQAMEVAALSPSSCNRQSFKFLFYNDRLMVDQISAIPGGVAGYEIPSVVIVVGSYRGYFDERDIAVPVIDSSLAMMAFLFTLETLGLSSVCINWPNLPDKEKRIRELVKIERDEFIVVMIGVGYADPEGKIPYSAKREVDELIFCNARVIGQQ